MFRFPLRATILVAALLAGCATTQEPFDERDPYEGFNRAMYRFNDALDRNLLKPVAEGYDAAMPPAASRGVSNFFNNLDDINVTLNDVLQGKFEQALQDGSRFVFNSTFGLAGLIDVASYMDLPKHDEDFGQTFAVWGMGPGPYLVLPILGPSTGRDTVGLVGDYAADPVWYIEDDTTYWATESLRTVDNRAQLLKAGRVMEQAALDPYAFLRDAYLQRRRSLIYDGNPPAPEFDFEFDFEEPAGEGGPE